MKTIILSSCHVENLEIQIQFEAKTPSKNYIHAVINLYQDDVMSVSFSCNF